MNLSGNLLYLLLLYAVLDKDNRLSTTSGLLVALAIMLYGTCRTAINVCCNNQRNNCNTNNNCGISNFAGNPFQSINNLF